MSSMGKTGQRRNSALLTYTSYGSVRYLRRNMSTTDCIVQMDFTENCVLSSAEATQSTYYGKEMITLHPVVIHYFVNYALQHNCLALLTDDRKHDVGAVFLFMKKITDAVKEINPAIQYLHYLTYIPMSQYRYATCFSIVAKHRSIFGINATWL